jgi:hypothetical protein
MAESAIRAFLLILKNISDQPEHRRVNDQYEPSLTIPMSGIRFNYIEKRSIAALLVNKAG